MSLLPHHRDGITDPKDLQLPFATKSARRRHALAPSTGLRRKYLFAQSEQFNTGTSMRLCSELGFNEAPPAPHKTKKRAKVAHCPSRKSYPRVAMMQSTQDGHSNDGTRPLDRHDTMSRL